MRELNCLRCGREMTFVRKEKLQLGQTGMFWGDLPNILAGALEVEIYACHKCGKLEFMMPGFPVEEEETPEFTEEELLDANANIVGVSMEGIPQVRCPRCGRRHDFDYPQCPHCQHTY